MTAEAAFPLRVAGPDVAATIMEALRCAEFSEAALAERLRVTCLDAVDQPVFKTLADRVEGAGALGVLARLFLFGDALERTLVRAHLSDVELDAFLTADLIRPWQGAAAGDAPHVFSPVRMVPMRVPRRAPIDLVVVSDRADHPDHSRFTAFSDIVFPGTNPLTRQFLRFLPTTPPATVLDLCAGTGVAALVMAAAGSHCTAADIAERSAHFARFNGWLNGCHDLTVVCGDLYEPAPERVDCVLAHPPYVPALTQTLTYRDGGETGDEIVRRIIAGAPEHLNVGGSFNLLCLGMDTTEGLFEQRVRQWLGPAETEFDLVFALDSTNPPELIATRLIERSGGSLSDLVRWRALFERLQVKEFVYGALIGRRFNAGAGEAFTRRVLMGEASTRAGFEWLFGWFDELRTPGAIDRLADARLRLPDDLKLDVQHRVEGGGFVPATYFLENGGRPFRTRIATEAWVAALLTRLDGSRPARAVYADAKAAGRVPPDFGDAALGRLLSFLFERGCLVADS